MRITIFPLGPADNDDIADHESFYSRFYNLDYIGFIEINYVGKSTHYTKNVQTPKYKPL